MKKWFVPLIEALGCIGCMQLCHVFVELNDGVLTILFGVSGVVLIALASVTAMKISNEEKKNKKEE